MAKKTIPKRSEIPTLTFDENWVFKKIIQVVYGSCENFLRQNKKCLSKFIDGDFEVFVESHKSNLFKDINSTQEEIIKDLLRNDGYRWVFIDRKGPIF